MLSIWLDKKFSTTMIKIEALKTLVWHLSRVPMKEMSSLNQSVENPGVAFVKGADERNKFFEKINDQ